MFEPFPGNYVWNLSINIALNGGGNIGELDRACRPVREAAARGEDNGTAVFFDSLLSVANQLQANGAVDEAAGRHLSASRKYRRVTTYLQTAGRMQARDYAPRKEAYSRALHLFRRSIELAGNAWSSSIFRSAAATFRASSSTPIRQASPQLVWFRSTAWTA